MRRQPFHPVNPVVDPVVMPLAGHETFTGGICCLKVRSFMRIFNVAFPLVLTLAPSWPVDSQAQTGGARVGSPLILTNSAFASSNVVSAVNPAGLTPNLASSNATPAIGRPGITPAMPTPGAAAITPQSISPAAARFYDGDRPTRIRWRHRSARDDRPGTTRFRHGHRTARCRDGHYPAHKRDCDWATRTIFAASGFDTVADRFAW